jgi:CRISPR-associated endonuclease/helicase Cas3
MSTILERLLHWLAELDCTVIILSATLPDTRRKALAKAYSGCDDAEYKRYPRITVARPRHYLQQEAPAMPTCTDVPMGEAKSVCLTVTGTDLGALATMLAEKLKNGGCAAVICNTVDRSIDVVQHLEANLQDTECLLFHARTLQMWRREREQEVLNKFGKNGERPNRAVLVATQVVEQSLDLDFDLMVSEIAPVDLLLQRSGRLHRHTRERPKGLEEPELIVLSDGEATGAPPETFGRNIEFVYDRYILLRTWLTLRERQQIEIPTEIEDVIEFVYAKEDAPTDGGWPETLSGAQHKMEFDRSESEKKACKLLVSKPKDPCDLIEQFNDELADDEDPDVHASVRAATREGDPSITVVMLPDGRSLTRDPRIPEVRDLLDHSVKISKRALFNELLNNGEQPKEWVKNAHLRYSRCVRLDGQNQGTVGDYRLMVDEKLGVVIAKNGGRNG